MDPSSFLGPDWWMDASSRDTQDLFRKRRLLAELMEDPPMAEVGQSPAQIVYAENKLKVLHYRPMVPRTLSPPVLVIYALINRPYILDLQPDKSVVRSLLLSGVDVYLIDWGSPSDRDRFLELDDYVNGYIHRVVKKVCENAGVDRLNLMGYCMGGTLTSMYASLHPERVQNLIIMAAPLDFSGDGGLLGTWSRKEYFDVDRVVGVMGNIPAEFLNGGYALLDPVGNLYSKYAKFLEKMDDRPFVEMFARMEKWVNDGIPLAGETFRQFIKWCYQEDRLMRGEIILGGRRVDLSSIEVPLLNIIGTYDHLVPPTMSRTLASATSSTDATTLEIPTGHIGLSVSSKSHRELWPKVAEWLWERGEEREQTRPISRSDSPYVDGALFETPPSLGEQEDEEAGTGIPAGMLPPFLTGRGSPLKDRTSSLRWHSGDTEKGGPHRHTWSSDVMVKGGGRPLSARLTSIKGIGPVIARKMNKAGIRDLGDLAGADTGALAAQTGVSRSRLNAWKRQALRLTSQ
jgi:polyhydroxyalkanoate synthase